MRSPPLQLSLPRDAVAQAAAALHARLTKAPSSDAAAALYADWLRMRPLFDDWAGKQRAALADAD